LNAVEEALRAGILYERTGGYHFTHALIRRTLYDGLSLARRQRLHLQVAEAIESTGDTRHLSIVTALATHYRLAGPAARPGKALTYTMQAADAAEAVFAWEEAARERQFALDLLDSDGSAATPAVAIQRCELLRAQGVVLARAAKIPSAAAVLQEAAALARTLDRPELFAGVILAYCDVPADPTSRTDQWAIDQLEEALRQLGDEATLLSPRVQACLARLLLLSGESERHQALGDAAVAAAHRAGDPETIWYVLKHYYRILANYRRHDALPAIAEEIVQVGQQMQRPEVVVEGLFWLFTALLEADDVAGAKAALDEHARLAEDIGFVFFQTQTAMWQAVWALFEGRIEESERLAQTALAIWQQAHEEASNTWYLTSIWFVLHRVALRRAQGRLAEIENDVVEMAVRPAIADHLFRMLPAYIQSLTGRPVEARQELATIFPSPVADWFPPTYNVAVVTFLAEACAILKDRARAPAVYDLLRPFAGRNAINWAWPICRGAVDHYLGLLAATMGDRPLAARHFEDALVMHTRAGARYYLAETQHAYAALLLAQGRRGDLPHARLLLDEAIATYDGLGMDHHATVARALLATADDTAAPSNRLHEPNGLSAREVEVLRLIAAGRSNRDIAAMLVISRNTVERHVNHIFTKTGAANRVEAAAYAYRHGLVE
jgi:DNA-binding NarL/FixJ family response regulator